MVFEKTEPEAELRMLHTEPVMPTADFSEWPLAGLETQGLVVIVYAALYCTVPL